MWWAEKEWRDHLFVSDKNIQNYSIARAKNDGRAQLAEELFTLIGDLYND
jgi:hypothetical protein